MKRQLFLYLFVSTCAALVDISIFSYLISDCAFDYRIALVCGFCAGVFVNFVLSDFFIFTRSEHESFWRACGRQYLASMSILALNQILMILVVQFLHVTHLVIARILVGACTFILNFMFARKYVFSTDTVSE